MISKVGGCYTSWHVYKISQRKLSLLIQIWCPEEDYEQNKSLMAEILDSMEIS
jgi:hypothetical protein